MQNKSQKEIIHDEKIQKLVTDIVERSSTDDDLPVRVMKELLENDEINEDASHTA